MCDITRGLVFTYFQFHSYNHPLCEHSDSIQGEKALNFDVSSRCANDPQSSKANKIVACAQSLEDIAIKGIIISFFVHRVL